jgi:hypothetical protein
MVSSLSFAVLLAFAPGCSTTRQTEHLLTAAGFKTVPASNPARQALLKSLPAGKVSSVQRDGKQYFVYPDAGQNVFYAGQTAQYEQYKKLRSEQHVAEENEQMVIQAPVQFDF